MILTMLVLVLALACQRKDDKVPVIEPPVNAIVQHNSVCIDRLYYNEDGTMKRIIMTSEGIQK